MNSVQEFGWRPQNFLYGLLRFSDRIDDLARTEAEAIKKFSADYGYIRSIPRRVEAVGPAQYTITDSGIQMRWLRGLTIPIDTGPGTIFRRVTDKSLAAGKWHYPGRLQPMADAAQDPRTFDEIQNVFQEMWRELIA